MATGRIAGSYTGVTGVGTLTAGTIGSGFTAIANSALANSTISGVALGGTLSALTATDTTLTFSGSYDGTTARTVGLNLARANTWSAIQTFTLAPVFTDQSGSRTALGLGSIATVASGTGVNTALAINVGSAGAIVTNGGALGTPSSGTATNFTGTAASLTAGNVTTNANLTGPITSSGNATSIASQTGTGTKFVVDTSPTLVTPILGVATATSINGKTVQNVSFSVHKNGTDQTGITNSTPVKATFSTKDFDVGTYFDTSASRYTPLVAGKYLFTAQTFFTGGVVDQQSFNCMIYKNGSSVKQGAQQASGTSAATPTCAVILDMNGTTDYVEVFAEGFGAGDKTLNGVAANTWFMGSLL